MNVPHSFHLSNQSFNSDFVEFVWQFPVNKELNQIVFKVCKNGDILLEEGVIDSSGEYKDYKYLTSGVLTTKNISFEQLTELKNEVIKFLK